MVRKWKLGHARWQRDSWTIYEAAYDLANRAWILSTDSTSSEVKYPVDYTCIPHQVSRSIYLVPHIVSLHGISTS